VKELTLISGNQGSLMYLILLLFFLGILKNAFSENLSEKSKIPFKKIKKSTKK